MKIHVRIAGAVTERTGRADVTLQPPHSCRLAPAGPRARENRTNLPATVPLVMPEAAGGEGGGATRGRRLASPGGCD